MTRLFYRGFSREEIDAFERALERVLKNLSADEEPMRVSPGPVTSP
jgi:hypothetical protein